MDQGMKDQGMKDIGMTGSGETARQGTEVCGVWWDRSGILGYD